MKKKKSERLAPVLELAQRKEDVAAKQLSEVLETMEHNKQQFDLLQTYLGDNQEQIRVLGKRGAMGDQLQRHQYFLQQLEVAITQQNERLKLLEQQVDAAKRNWQQLYFRRKAVGEHIEKIRRQEVKIIDKKIQTEMDDRPYNPFKY